MKKRRPWPTLRLPPFKTPEGDYCNWSAEDKRRFHEWATRLKDYAGDRFNGTKVLPKR